MRTSSNGKFRYGIAFCVGQLTNEIMKCAGMTCQRKSYVQMPTHSRINAKHSSLYLMTTSSRSLLALDFPNLNHQTSRRKDIKKRQILYADFDFLSCLTRTARRILFQTSQTRKIPALAATSAPYITIGPVHQQVVLQHSPPR